MNKAAIYHITGGSFAFPLDRKTLKIRLKAARKDLKEVVVVYGTRYPEDGSEPHKYKKLELVASDEENDYFATTISLDDARFRYHFYLDDGHKQYWYNEKGIFRQRPRGFKAGFFQYPYINPNGIFKTPDWVKDAIFYEIFPERFYNGDPSNDPEGVETWGERPGRKSFFGGDLEGIIKKLDYLEDLGINALYLTPIFKSRSNHKYNIDDYFQIDPHFGDKETARRLIKEAHKRGMRVILDAVFNHCGFDFFAFKDVREKGEKSPYADWFDIEDYPVKTDYPVNYKTFANHISSMPKLMTHNPEVKEYLLKVARYWLEELDADGYRLDVADEVDHYFWREFRKVVKGVKEDAYIVGEIWHDSQPWLQGDQYDAVMNYPFAEAIYDFFARKKIGAAEFDARLSRNRMNYHDEVNYAMLNLTDSHDTPRMLHVFNENKEKMRLAVLFQLTYLGAPMIYYGDEIGITGGDDPDCRRCMVWNKKERDNELWAYYKKLISIRKKLPVLRRGDYKTVIIDNMRNIYGFERSYKGEKVVVILNNSSVVQKVGLAANLFDSEKIIDYMANKEYKCNSSSITLKLPAYGGMILG